MCITELMSSVEAVYVPRVWWSSESETSQDIFIIYISSELSELLEYELLVCKLYVSAEMKR